VLAASGLGGVLGSVVASRFPAPRWVSPLQVQMLAWTAAFAVLAAPGGESVPYMALAMAILGFTGALGNVEWGSYLMERVKEGMFARVTSTGRLLPFGACAAGPAVGGILTSHFGVERAVVWLFLATTTLMVSSFAFNPWLRCRVGTALPAQGRTADSGSSQGPIGDEVPVRQ
jgi:hypothetical protein